MQKKSNNHASLSVSSLTSNGSLHELIEEKQSFNITFGSIEAINGASFSNGGNIPYSELAEENSEFRKTIKDLHDETTNLKNNLIVAEDANALMTSKNHELKSKLKSMKNALDKAMRYQVELDDLKTVARNSEEECYNYQAIAATKDSRVAELMQENTELRASLDEAHDKLDNALRDLKKSKASHNQTVDKLKQEKCDMEKKLNDTVSLAFQMEQKIEELKSDLSNVRESQFFQKTPPIFDTGESDVLGPSFDDADPFELRRPMSLGPVANSTPYLKRQSKNNGVRGSIGDEIKMVGIQGSSPLCEKSALLNGSVFKTTESCTQTPFSTSMPYFGDYLTWKNVSVGAGLAIFVLIMTFTFFGALEIENGRKLMPILWSPWMPEPIAVISIYDPAPRVW